MAGISDWNGRVAVVTGGASGIGRGIAEALVRHGATVIIADLDEDALVSAAAEIGAFPVRTDVTDPSSVQALADDVVASRGRVDLLVNNAGVGPESPISSIALADWKWVLDVNLWGVIHGIHAFLPHLRANPDGAWLVNTSSMSMFLSPPGFAPYVASKAAVDALSHVLRAEFETDGVGIGVTVLHPGTVSTNIKHSLRSRPPELDGGSGLTEVDLAERLPTARWVTPAEVGELVVRSIERGDAYAFTHPELRPRLEAGFASVTSALARETTNLTGATETAS
ncbi:acetoin dehydrogenase [Pseudoclavibacter endophyticus]|uniref:SDR family NAD(P)-dependent oxidoreductase n=1 Tax=Pseudoclavibacter endophyticus TaxID=1778590 RepID=A0A6H9WJC5_9MICO|nr:SDR family NAD(P)-dependent oxidoreductase [Pseudoclavibacter endophyticus]KAB1648916.1 SDR family NAD(P)-dependent oxidoreductase [Pseudoclavibacter endophyticus]GGA67267.1 acetoin dehydrogenase [Pseudoclavibacter endophyticus]